MPISVSRETFSYENYNGGVKLEKIIILFIFLHLTQLLSLRKWRAHKFYSHFNSSVPHSLSLSNMVFALFFLFERKKLNKLKKHTGLSSLSAPRDTGCSGTAPDSLSPEDGHLGPQTQRYVGRRIKKKQGNL